MAERTGHNERRQHQRSAVSSGVIAVLITSAPEIIGSVTDISLGGAKITYHDPKHIALDFARCNIDLISDDRYVEAIPCTNPWSRPVESNDLVAAGDLRQCGIQFVDLTPNQLFLLRGFISRCAISAKNLQHQPDIFASTDQ